MQTSMEPSGYKALEISGMESDLCWLSNSIIYFLFFLSNPSFDLWYNMTLVKYGQHTFLTGGKSQKECKCINGTDSHIRHQYPSPLMECYKFSNPLPSHTIHLSLSVALSYKLPFMATSLTLHRSLVEVYLCFWFHMIGFNIIFFSFLRTFTVHECI